MPHSKELSGQSSEPQNVLVTGATGQQGGALSRLLLKRGHHVRAMSRKPDGPAAGELRKLGAEVVPGDFADRGSVERAAKGMDVAFIVATPFEKGPAAEAELGKNALDGVRAAGVPYVVYSSVSDADRKTGIPHFDSKAEIEDHLRSLGTDYSVVAPVFFMENLFAPWAAAGFGQGVFATGILPDRKLQLISLPEIAEFTTLAVEQPRTFRGKRFNIASDSATPSEIAQQLSKVVGAKITYRAIPLEQVRQQSEDFAKMYDWFNRVGYSVDIPRLKADFPQVHWRPFSEWTGRQDWSRVLTGSGKR